MPPDGAENETSDTAGVPLAVNRFVRFFTMRLIVHPWADA